MKKIFTLISTVFLVTAINAQNEPVKSIPVSDQKPVKDEQVKPAPSLIAAPVEEAISLKETAFDFGKIPQGKPVTHVFDVKNIGKDSLKIVHVQASCGCTTPEWEHDKAIAPGASTKITVGYNAAASGPFTKTITITYNGTQSKVITISGEVWQTPAASAPENKATNDLKN
jgi:hypothetical protein